MGGRNSPEANRRGVRKLINAKKAFINDWKSSGCAHCGETDVIVLEAHHIDPSSKDPSFRKIPRSSKPLYSFSWPMLKVELTKCIVLCANCHRREQHNMRLKELNND